MRENIFEHINNCMVSVEKPEFSVQEKRDAFQRIIDYVGDVARPMGYCEAILTAISDELTKEYYSNQVLRQLIEELRVFLSIPRFYCKNKKEYVLIGKNWVADAVKDILKHNALCVSWDRINWKYIDMVQAKCIICDRNQAGKFPFEKIEEERLLQLDYLITCDFINTPVQKEMFCIYEEESSKRQIDGIITGLSYGRDDIHVDLLNGKWVTLANSSQDLFIDLHCLKAAYQRNPSMKFAICVLAPYSLRHDMSMTPKKNDLTMFYYTVFGTIHNNTELKERVEKYNKEKQKAELFFGECISGVRWEDCSNYIYKTYFMHQSNSNFFNRMDVFDQNDIRQKEIEMIKKQYRKPYVETIQENKEILKEYCAFCEEKEIKLLLFIPPYSDYYRGLWREEYYEELMTYIYCLKEYYHFTCIDMAKDRFPNYCFRDTGHLNRIGAVHVAEHINKYII